MPDTGGYSEISASKGLGPTQMLCLCGGDFDFVLHQYPHQ